MIRPLYLFLKFSLKPTLWIYYPRFKTVNAPKKRLGHTIFMSNHAAAFMDPLVVASKQQPIVFFMTRSDVFTTALQPVLWASHMLPIYREQDGQDTKAKNEAVFKKCSQILRGGRNLLIFAEGFTDDVFVRRLKPIKKGGIRIGFSSLVECNWEKDIYLQAVGVNYADPNFIGGDCVISNSDPIRLNDYKEEFEQDPNLTISRLTRLMQVKMREQLTDVRNKRLTDFHEHIMRITRKGMNAKDTNREIPLLERWNYSKRLANWFNTTDIEGNEKLMSLKDDLITYFDLLEKERIEETHLYNIVANRRSKWREILFLIFLLPIFFLGFLLVYPPYKVTKNFAEKSFKRKVFWGSVKMKVGFAFVAIYNLIIYGIIAAFTSVPFMAMFFAGMFSLPLIGIIAFQWNRKLKDFKAMNALNRRDFSSVAMMRQNLVKKINDLVPVK